MSQVNFYYLDKTYSVDLSAFNKISTYFSREKRVEDEKANYSIHLFSQFENANHPDSDTIEAFFECVKNEDKLIDINKKNVFTLSYLSSILFIKNLKQQVQKYIDDHAEDLINDILDEQENNEAVLSYECEELIGSRLLEYTTDNRLMNLSISTICRLIAKHFKHTKNVPIDIGESDSRLIDFIIEYIRLKGIDGSILFYIVHLDDSGFLYLNKRMKSKDCNFERKLFDQILIKNPAFMHEYIKSLEKENEKLLSMAENMNKELQIIKDQQNEFFQILHHINEIRVLLPYPSKKYCETFEYFYEKIRNKEIANIKLVTCINVLDETDVTFQHNEKVEIINIKEGVQKIACRNGKGFFEGCSYLSSVNISDSVSIIGERTFQSCIKLKEINLPRSITIIGKHCFTKCSSLTKITIPLSVTSIGDFSFSECSSLTEILLPETINHIGEHVFDGIRNIKICGNMKILLKNLFRECKSLTTITLPISLEVIGDYSFSGCSSLTQIAISSSVKSIGDYTFLGCSSLKEIIIPSSVESIGNNVFSGCSSLTQITLSPSVRSIRDYAFLGCSSLKEITIPSSVESIGNYSFSECSSLKEITIPSSVKSLGLYSFSGCSKLEQIQFPFSKNFIASLTSIGDYSFSECSSLKEITIPSSVTSIGNYSFLKCSSL